MAIEPLEDYVPRTRAHGSKLPRGRAPAAFRDHEPNPGDVEPGSPGPGWRGVHLYAVDDPGGRGLLYAWARQETEAHATVTITGVPFRLDLATGMVARYRQKRWVPTRWRILPWWTGLVALAAFAGGTYVPDPWTGETAQGEDVPHAR